MTSSPERVPSGMVFIQDIYYKLIDAWTAYIIAQAIEQLEKEKMSTIAAKRRENLASFEEFNTQTREYFDAIESRYLAKRNVNDLMQKHRFAISSGPIARIGRFIQEIGSETR